MTLSVLHVVDSLRPRPGSVALVLPGLLGALRSHDVDGVVMAGEIPNPLPAGATVQQCDRVALERALRQAHLLHIHGWGGAVHREAAKAAIRARKRYIISPFGWLTSGYRNRGGWLTRFRRKWTDSRLIRSAAFLTALNSHEQSALGHVAPRTRITLLSYGLCYADYNDISAAEPIGEEFQHDGPILLVLGPIHPAEGCTMLLKAFAELGKDADGWSIVLAGEVDGQWWNALEAAIGRKGGADRVRKVDADEVTRQQRWLARSSLVVAPSPEPRFPVTTFQATAAATPLLASETAAPPSAETVTSVFPPRRDALRTALREALRLEDRQRRERALGARDRACLLWDWHAQAPRFLDVYGQLAG